MTRRSRALPARGYFALGVYRAKTEVNVGTLWRSASLYGAAFVFTVGRRYQRQSSDTPNTPAHTPLFHFDTLDEAIDRLPHSCPLVGIELTEDAKPLPDYAHPLRAAYLLGAEDHGLPHDVLARCHDVVTIPSRLPESMNVAVAGSLVAYDRYLKEFRA